MYFPISNELAKIWIRHEEGYQIVKTVTSEDEYGGKCGKTVSSGLDEWCTDKLGNQCPCHYSKTDITKKTER